MLSDCIEDSRGSAGVVGFIPFMLVEIAHFIRTSEREKWQVSLFQEGVVVMGFLLAFSLLIFGAV